MTLLTAIFGKVRGSRLVYLVTDEARSICNLVVDDTKCLPKILLHVLDSFGNTHPVDEPIREGASLLTAYLS